MTNGTHVGVTIRDDGPGVDPEQTEGSRGLLNMADRIAALGGDFDLHSAPGQGTTITARVPASTAGHTSNA